MDYDPTNTGIISKNERKEKETHPDIRGQLNVEGVEYWVDGWRKERKDGTGSFYSLRIKPKDASKTRQATPAPADYQKAKEGSVSRVPGSFADMDDEPPF
jgi:hypothetical protein